MFAVAIKADTADSVINAITSPTVIAAALAVAGVVMSAIFSLRIARATSHSLLATDRSKRQSEIALKISELMSDPDDLKRKSARRRFAVGIIKIVEAAGNRGEGAIHFIPMNSRVTVGRDEDNDIILRDDMQFLSRWHCGFIADQRDVYIDDYLSTNKTHVNNYAVTESTKLEDGDEINLGAFTLKFQRIRENTILSQ